MKLLLINPRFPESFWSLKWATDHVLQGARTTNPPLGLATVAAMSPPDWEVEIVDENVESVPLQPDADLIGICGMGVQFPRQQELLTFYRRQGYHVVAGGSYASLCPEKYTALADTVIAGEAEYIWPEFCRDFEKGAPRALYQETGEVDLTDSPVPRFDLLDLSKYGAVSLQFSRGCPFRCEFCDIIVMFGRKPRTKSLEQVGRELDALRQLGAHNLFFVDDNLIGNKPVAKSLLRYLRDYQQQHGYKFEFGTEASLNMAQDEELLRLFREANFKWVFIGIESPDEASLKETKKFQNTRQDILSSVREIYRHGLDIYAGFIIGFDNDTVETFDKQFRFIMEAGIQTAMVGLLTALPKTPLYERLEQEGRLLSEADDSDNTRLGTNLIPKGMSYQEMIEGYYRLYHRLLEDRHIAARIRNKGRYLTHPVFEASGSPGKAFQMLSNFLLRGILPGGIRRIYHFVRTLPLTHPRRFPLVIKDWAIGLSMKDYVQRHFDPLFEPEPSVIERHLINIRYKLRRYLRGGNVEIWVNQLRHTADELSISIRGKLDRSFFSRAPRHLKRVLKHTSARITLTIEELQENQLRHLQRMLRRLSRYGDRISIAVSEHLQPQLQIDSSRFHLILVAEK